MFFSILRFKVVELNWNCSVSVNKGSAQKFLSSAAWGDNRLGAVWVQIRNASLDSINQNKLNYDKKWRKDDEHECLIRQDLLWTNFWLKSILVGNLIMIRVEKFALGSVWRSINEPTCSKALLSRPLRLLMFWNDSQWYSRISRNLHTYKKLTNLQQVISSNRTCSSRLVAFGICKGWWAWEAMVLMLQWLLAELENTGLIPASRMLFLSKGTKWYEKAENLLVQNCSVSAHLNRN